MMLTIQQYSQFSNYQRSKSMIAMSLIDQAVKFIQGEAQYDNCWQVRTIRFDVDPEQPLKSFQKYLAISYHVEDAKGNPGHKGHFFITNLRVQWQMQSDHYINLSFGLDTILKIQVKTIPVGGSGFKHLLTVKTQSISQSRYSFKFIGFTQKELQVFEKLQNIHQKAVKSKNYRSINLSIPCDPEIQLLNLQEIKSKYSSSILYQDTLIIKCQIILTNIRIIIVKNQEKKMNYGISWFMIRNVEMQEDEEEKNKIILRCRGILSRKKIKVACQKEAQTKRLQLQLKSYCQTFNKSPILGMNFDMQIKKEQKVQESQIEQIQHTKINLIKRKNAYNSENKGSLNETFFSTEVGLMMQKFPENTIREDLWEILKN